MGFLDNMSTQLRRGGAAVGRTTESARLRMEAEELLRKRKDLAAQLGAALYEKTRENMELRASCETLYDGIAEIDAQRAAIDARLSDLERMADDARRDAMTYRCPSCGTTVHATDSFCKGCGKSIGEIRSSYAPYGQSVTGGITCPSCGAPVNADDLFCMSCGSRIPSPAQEAEPPASSTAAQQSDALRPYVVTEGETGAFAEADATLEQTEQVSISVPACEERKRVCPQCGQPLNGTDAFCGYCGARL